MHSHRLPNLRLPSTQSSSPTRENTINRLIQRCNEIQNNVNYTYESLREQQKVDITTSQSQEFVFSKTPMFKVEKERLKENIRKYVEQKYSGKLKKVKSVIKPSEKSRELLGPDDVQTSEAAKFLSLNKRQFGNTAEIAEVTYERPFKSKKRVAKINPVETVLTNIQSILHNNPKQELENLIKEYRRNTELLAFVQEGSARNHFVEKELIKLWPASDEATNKKRTFFKHRIEKLVALNRESSNFAKQANKPGKRKANGYLSA
jgi:ribosomal protein L23